MGWLVFSALGIVAVIVWAAMEEHKKVSQMSPEELAKYRKSQAEALAEQRAQLDYGTRNSEMICVLPVGLPESFRRIW
jgi:hypothetical protein